MMSGDKKKTILTIKNSLKQMDLLRVHIYEFSIRFDKKIDDAINKYPNLKEEVEELNFLWKNQKITEKQILVIILHLMGKYGTYLEEFYFKKEELDENGCYIDTEYKNNYFIDEPLDGTDPEEEREFFYLYLKEQGLLKKISKKTFESEISEKEAEEYVEKYVYKGASFFRGIIEEDKFTSTWYFMIVENSIRMAFEKITN